MLRELRSRRILTPVVLLSGREEDSAAAVLTDGLGVKMQCKRADLRGGGQCHLRSGGRCILLRPPYNGTDLGYQYRLAEGFGHIIIRTETQALASPG